MKLTASFWTAPPITIRLFQKLPPTGVVNACAAATTPGIARTRSMGRAFVAARASSGDVRLPHVERRGEDAVLPEAGSIDVRFLRLRANSSAPTTSTSDSATCKTTSARRTPKRSRPSVIPRLPAFIVAPGDVRVARIAGVRPKSRHAVTATAAVNAKTRQSRPRSTNSGLSLVLRKATSDRLNHCATTTPAAAPIAAMSRLSDSICRTMRRRDAPMASRTATSRSRAVARASIRFARFAQAMSSTSPVTPSRMLSESP